jgi:hypothetical protein
MIKRKNFSGFLNYCILGTGTGMAQILPYRYGTESTGVANYFFFLLQQFRPLVQSSTPLSASSLVSSNKASTDDSMSDASG